MTQNSYDPWDAANNAKPVLRSFFGLIELDVWACVLVKGVGKVPFDPQVHRVEERVTAIKIIATPLPSSNLAFATEREMIHTNNEWTKITLPSIHALAVTPNALHGKWARYEMVPTGRTYTNRNGEEKESTAFRFLQVFNSEAEAEAAVEAFYNGKGNGSNGDTPAPSTADDGQRTIAFKFLEALVAQAAGDMTKLDKLIASNSLVGKYFNINSQEVIDLVGRTQPATMPF